MDRWKDNRDYRYPIQRKFSRSRGKDGLFSSQEGILPPLGEIISKPIRKIIHFFRNISWKKHQEDFSDNLPKVPKGIAALFSLRLFIILILGVIAIILLVKFLPNYLVIEPVKIFIHPPRPILLAPPEPLLELPRGLFSLEADSISNLVENSVIVQRGGTLSQALEDLGLTLAQNHQVVDLLSREKLFQVLKPGDMLKAYWADALSESSLVKVEFYQNNSRRPIVAVPGGPDHFFLFSTQSRPVSIHEATAGTINNSFYIAGVEANLEPRFIMNLTDILASQIDFMSGIQPGDNFQLLFKGIYRDGVLAESPILEMILFNNHKTRHEFFRFETQPGQWDYYDTNFHSIKKSFLASPLQYTRISSSFSHSRMHPIYKELRPHLGVDYAAPLGTPVSAVSDGTVKFSGRQNGYGLIVILSHTGGYETMYSHLSRISEGIVKGAKVSQGQVIGKVGATGTATGPHLDFRLKLNGEYKNPLVELPAQQGNSLAPEFKQEFTTLVDNQRERLRTLLSWSGT
ncbi:MAG: M23 family metallopeptidase [Deltaproteobacteria bacterium]|jgi:murein DD-endopeptidase MepM/ murein hydrolase activator NlpD|nr:M23 family metallopeptidase [Deltaproteobacteria bacterium]